MPCLFIVFVCDVKENCGIVSKLNNRIILVLFVTAQIFTHTIVSIRIWMLVKYFTLYILMEKKVEANSSYVGLEENSK